MAAAALVSALRPLLHRSAPRLLRREVHLSSPSPTSSPSSPPTKLNVMFFGTDNFAVSSLRWLRREQGEGGVVGELAVAVLAMRSLTPAVAEYARRHHLPLHTWPPDPEEVRAQGFHLGVVASFGRLLPAALIASFPLGMINVHGSLLPRWRGAAPVVHAIAAGDTATGVTIMRVRPRRFDVGEVLAMREVPIGAEARRAEVTEELGEVGAELLGEVVRDFPSYSAGARAQGDEGVTLAPLVTKAMARVDFEQLEARQVYDLWRAVGDLSKLRTIYQETGEVVLLATCLPPATTSATTRLPPAAAPGTLHYLKLGKKQKYLCVRCREGWVAFTGIFYGKRKEMSPVDFYNGFLSKPGEHRFVSCDIVPPPDGA